MYLSYMYYLPGTLIIFPFLLYSSVLVFRNTFYFAIQLRCGGLLRETRIHLSPPGGVRDMATMATRAFPRDPTPFHGCIRDLVVNGRRYMINEHGNIVITA